MSAIEASAGARRSAGAALRRIGCPSIPAGALPARRVIATAAASAPLRRACIVRALQGGGSGGMPPRPGPGPMPPGGGVPQAGPLARRPGYATAPPQPVFLDLSQVLGKQVITRTSGRALGVASAAWLDPARRELVSLDLTEKRGLSASRAGNVPLAALRQIGDVVLVHDEGCLYEPDLDGRMGFVNPLGLEVRTRSGEYLGKVRDLSFSPDTGQVGRMVYDEFGIPSLPLSFFDCFSIGMGEVLSIGRGEVILYDEAKYRERKEANGMFAAIPALLRSLGGGGGGGVGSMPLALPPAGTTEAYRSGAGRLPSNYTQEQWQADLRRWEAETGMTYEQYISQQQAAARGGGGGATAGAVARGVLPQARGAPPPQQQQQQRVPAYGAYEQQQQQQQARYGQRPPDEYDGVASVSGQPYAAGPLRSASPASRYAPAESAYAADPGQYGSATPGQYGSGTTRQPAARPPAARPAGAIDPRLRAPAGARPAAGDYPPAAPQERQPWQQQQPPQPWQQQQQPTQQQQQQQQQQAAPPPGMTRAQAPPAGGGYRSAGGTAAAVGASPVPSRRVEEWIDRDTRPRIADALAEGAFPLGGPAAAGGTNGSAVSPEGLPPLESANTGSDNGAQQR